MLVRYARAGIVAAFLWGAVVGNVAPAFAHAPGLEFLEHTGLVVGPSVGWGRAGAGNQVLLGMDLTLREFILWQSVGVRVAADQPRFLMPYLEFGIWFLANWGVGYSTTIANGKSSDYFNLFVGFPVPWDGRGSDVPPHLFTKDTPSFIEPYYRPAFRFGGEGASVVHEAGILLKFMYDFGR